MKITANNITFSRILLLPIPCYLVYGDMTSKVIGLILFVILGFSDYADGILARRNGVTILGSLLDPIADKIFIVAVYIPLGDMGVIPFWAVFVLLAREFAVTSLRSIFLEYKVDFKTSEFAKYKTNVQMAGSGFIFLTYIFGDTSTDLIIMVAISLVALIMLFIKYFITGRIGQRVYSAVILLSVISIIRAVLSPKHSIWVYVAIVLFFTLVSGAQYVFRGWHKLSRQAMKVNTRNIHLVLYYPFVFPALFVGILYYAHLMTWAVILIISLELAINGLDNRITSCDQKINYSSILVKSIVQVTGGLVALAAGYFQFDYGPQVFAVILSLVACITGIYTLLFFYRYRELLTEAYGKTV